VINASTKLIACGLSTPTLPTYMERDREDLKAVNTFVSPAKVAPRPLDPPKVGGMMTFRLPARSYIVAAAQI